MAVRQAHHGFDKLTTGSTSSPRVRQAHHGFGKLTTRFGKLTTRFDKLTTRFDKLTTRFGKLTTRFDRLTTGSVSTPRNLGYAHVGSNHYWLSSLSVRNLPLRMHRSRNLWLMLIFMVGLSGCAGIIELSENLPGKHNTVRVIRHRGYYKDHIYAKHPHIGRFPLTWLEKPQGTKKAGLRRVRRH